jgi:hypothetical protein
MKIVINKCHGGFGLSPVGLKRYTELKGIECFFFGMNLKDNEYNPLTIEEASETSFWTAFSVPNPEKVLPDQSKFFQLSLEERKESNKLYNKYSISKNDIERNDPFLIKVIEELGDKANGKHCKLKIVEIPDGVDWEIDEYDGLEKISEKHRIWE